MLRGTIIFLVSSVLVLSLVGCGAAAPARTEQSSAPDVAPQPAQPAAGAAESTAGGAASSPVAQDADRMILRTADLSLVVTDAQQAQDAIIDAVEGMGGYVAEARSWRENEQLRAVLSVRVPAERLESLLDSAAALAVRVGGRNIRSQDVTEEYTDLNSQLTNLEATERELRELLTDVRERTQKASEVLEVYRELTSIRSEIERVKGRMQYLSKLTALATANIELVPDILAKPVVEPGWRPAETLKNAGRSLVNTMKGLVDAGIWLIVFVVPILLIVAIPIVVLVLLVRWLVRKGRARPRTA